MKKVFILLSLLFCCLGPYWLAYEWYVHRATLKFHQQNKGLFLYPSSEIKILLWGQQGVLGRTRDNPHDWLLLLILNRCDPQDQQSIFYLHQLVKSLGQKRQSLSIAALFPINCPLKSFEEYSKRDYIPMSIKPMSCSFYTKFNDFLSMKARQNVAQTQQGLYVVDPRGYLVLYYPLPWVWMDVRRDLAVLISGGARF